MPAGRLPSTIFRSPATPPQTRPPSGWKPTRREFLATAGAAFGAAALSPLRPRAAWAGYRFEPEYAGRLDRVFFVYDQIRSPFQFSEAAEIASHLPPGAKVFALAPEARAEEAVRRFKDFGVNAEAVPAPADASWHWGRDVGQLGWPGGRRTLLAPWNKNAAPGDDLAHAARTVRALRRLGVEVAQAPLSFEGGNLMLDRIGRHNVLFAGQTAILDTLGLHRRWLGKKLRFEGALALFREVFGADEVIPLGRRVGGEPRRQAEFVFHIDMAVAIPREGTAVVQAFDASAARLGDLEEEIRAELEACFGEEEGRRAIEALVRKEGIECELPLTPGARDTRARELARSEARALEEAERECDAHRAVFERLGYEVIVLESDWRRVRRFQAHTNVIPSCDRLLIPVFPDREALVAWTLPLGNGRRVAALRPTGRTDLYRLEGTNRRAYELFRGLVPNVRVIPDRFYLTGGNVHCVVGRL